MDLGLYPVRGHGGHWGRVEGWEWEEETENAIKKKLYGEIPSDERLFLYCGLSNMKLGYLIIAE